MDRRTKEALEGSIRKWEEILYYGGEDRGIDNCPLCRLFYVGHLLCDACPIGKTTGQSLCRNTPYEEWTSHSKKYHGKKGFHPIECPTCQEIAERELRFLRSLLPSTKEEPEPPQIRKVKEVIILNELLKRLQDGDGDPMDVEYCPKQIAEDESINTSWTCNECILMFQRVGIDLDRLNRAYATSLEKLNLYAPCPCKLLNNYLVIKILSDHIDSLEEEAGVRVIT